jgi:hypothetical protein
LSVEKFIWNLQKIPIYPYQISYILHTIPRGGGVRRA